MTLMKTKFYTLQMWKYFLSGNWLAWLNLWSMKTCHIEMLMFHLSVSRFLTVIVGITYLHCMLSTWGKCSSVEHLCIFILIIYSLEDQLVKYVDCYIRPIMRFMITHHTYYNICDASKLTLIWIYGQLILVYLISYTAFSCLAE